MSEHKQIERVFQEAFSGFEAKPNKHVWTGLQSELKQKEKKKSIFFWMMSATAILLLGFSSYMWLNAENSIKSNRVATKNSTAKPVVFDNEALTFNVIPTNFHFDNNANSPLTTSPFFFNFDESKFNFKLNNDFSLTNYTSYMNPNSTYVGISDSKAKQSLQKKELKESNIENTIIAINTKKWELTPYVNTVYFNSLKQGSPLDESLKDNKKEFETSQSFGFNLARTIGKKWKIETGISLLKLNYSTFNIAFKNDFNASRFAGVSYNQFNRYTSVRDVNNTVIAWNEHEGRIKQEIEYLEIPFAVSYTIKNNKHIDLGVTGGVSSLFLTNNRLSLHDINTGEETYFGKANNLSMINASANASIDFNYHISKSIHFNISPSFKYYMEMFEENNGDFKPYSIGISTGLKVKF